jgi:hypothetical protein
MVVTKSTVERRVGVPAQLLHEREDAAELLIHALAQLPDDVHGSVPVSPVVRRRLELLARAYGIQARLTFDDGDVSGDLLEDLIRRRRPLGEIVEALFRPSDRPASLRFDDEIFRGHRIALVTNIPTHYRVPLFEAMARRLAAAGAGFRVYFLADVPPGREWMRTEAQGFDHETLESIDLSRDRGRRLLPLRLVKRLDESRPTLLLVGGFSPFVAMRVAAYAARRKLPFGVWSGEIPSRPTARSRTRSMQRKWIIARASFAVSYGWESARYLCSLRPDLPLVIGRNTAPIGQPRARPDDPETIEILTVGRAEKGKALDVVLNVISKLETQRWRLTVIGDGPELEQLRRHADSRVRFLGARPFDEVADAYSKADVFLFPSRYDIFGLVLVEAMGAGMAVAVSRAVGAAADLAVDGVNCILVGDDDPESWAHAVAQLASDKDLRSKLGANGRATIGRRWTIEHAADAMLAGMRLPLLSLKGRVG